VRGENDGRIRMIGRDCVHVEAIVFNGRSSCLIAEAAEFAIQVISDCRFVSGNRFNVDQLPSERDRVHGKKG